MKLFDVIFRARAAVIATLALLTAFGASSQEFPAGYRNQLEKQWQAHPTLNVGMPMPAASLKGIDSRVHSLTDYKDSPLLAVVFICNHCPASQLYEDRIKALEHDYGNKGLKVVAIQPNGPVAMAPRELNYSDLDDSFESMIQHAEYRHFSFPYLYDGDTQEVAAKFGPKVTPHIFIFDKERKLRFEGRIDDALNEQKVKTRDARNAIDALLAGKPVPVDSTAVFGCSVKWNNQTEGRDRELKEWKAAPVTISKATVDDLKKLRANGTGKTVMINFWATWCGPCVTEFQNMLQTHLWYRSRDFELITVSANAPEEHEAVLKFLEKEHSAVRNLQFESDDFYAMQAAFDPEWKSGVPFTVVIGPKGNLIYREEGEISILALRRAVLATLPDAGMFAGNSAYWAKK